MDKKKNTKRIIGLICIVVVVALLAAMPLIAKQTPEEDSPKASILSGKAALGSIPTELIGGGQLTEEEAVTISVPSAVKLKSFLVTNGDTVAEGDALATADRVTVMEAIAQVQETLEYLSEQIEKTGEVSTKESVTALAGGTVKILYAKKGDSVQSVMLEHGALAVLSLDGLMAVDLETDSAILAGTTVTVTLSSGKQTTGKVVKNLLGSMTVTVEDKNYPVNDFVTVSDAEGQLIGAGELYIYSPWSATAYAGTVDSVKVSAGDKLSAGKTLMVLKDVGYSAAYRQLISQRQEYEELMLQLFQMYQTETVVAPCDGVVTGIDKNSIQLLAAGNRAYSLDLLANAPNGDDETAYMNYLGKITLVASNGWAMDVSPQAVPVADYAQLLEMPFDESALTMSVLNTQTEIPVFTMENEQWMLVDRATVGVGDVMLFATDDQGNLIWSVLVQKAQAQPEDPDGTDTPDDPGASGQPSVPGGNGGGFPGGGNFPSGGGTGNFPNGGNSNQEDVFELYGLDMAQIAVVTPQNTMTLEITIDELDVKALQVGMEAQVKINAMGGEKHTATISQIGNTGTNNGGSSKFTVTLTMERQGDMLAGMNATATIVLRMQTNALTIPAAALVEKDNQTVVYTGYDEKNETLLNPVVVTVGASDGQTVEILDGLTEGQTYYYAYYDTLEISFAPDFGGSGFFGR